MELRVLRNFLAVAREGTVTHAAERLFLSQPALSKQLKELEEELGCLLFTRGARRLSLTPEGHLFRARAEEILALADRARAELAAGEALAGTLAIGAGETPAMRLLARAAVALRARHPAVRLALHSGNAQDVAARLERGLDDFGLLIAPFDLAPYDFLRLPRPDRWGLLLRKDCPLAAKPAVAPGDLAGLPLLVSRQARVPGDLAAWLGRPTDGLCVVGTYNLAYNAALMVAEGLGCALVLDGLADVSPGSPLAFRPLAPALTADVALVWERHRPLSRPARAFLGLLRAELGAPTGK